MKRERGKKYVGLAAMLLLVFLLSACGQISAMSSDINDETGACEVTAENIHDSGCTGHVTIRDGECLAVSPNLQKGYIIISLHKGDEFDKAIEENPSEELKEMAEENEDTAILTEKIEGNDVSVFPVAAGEYYVFFRAEEEKTTGTISVMPFSISELKEQNPELAKTLGEAAQDAGTTGAPAEEKAEGGSASAAGSNSEAAANEDGQNPAMKYMGSYGWARATIQVKEEGENNVKFVVTWGSSAWEYSEWTMSGPFDEKTLTVKYSNCVKKDCTYNEDGEIATESIGYENGTGTITFKDAKEPTLTWEDDQENVAEDAVFTWYTMPTE